MTIAKMKALVKRVHQLIKPKQKSRAVDDALGVNSGFNDTSALFVITGFRRLI